MYHALNLIPRKSVMLMTGSALVRCSELMGCAMSDMQIIYLSRLLLLFEYQLRHLYETPPTVLEQVITFFNFLFVCIYYIFLFFFRLNGYYLWHPKSFVTLAVAADATLSCQQKSKPAIASLGTNKTIPYVLDFITFPHQMLLILKSQKLMDWLVENYCFQFHKK